MSTRCQIIVKKGDFGQDVLIYRHSDGYPEGKSGVVSDLKKALKFSWQLPRMESDDFAAGIVAGWHTLKRSQSTWGDKTHWHQGGNLRLEGGYKGPASRHGDIEWLYIVSPDKEAGRWALKVYDVHFGQDFDPALAAVAWEGHIGDTFPEKVLELLRAGE